MANLATALLDTDTAIQYDPAQDITSLYDRASHVTVRTYRAGTRPIYSDLTSIIINGARYADKVAACACADLELFKLGDTGYTRCTLHGVLSIGYLRRELTKGAK